jgi:ATP-dependent DNA helicase DinG
MIEDLNVYNNIKLKHTPRPEQTKLLDFTIESIKNNKKFILVDASVGIGKSYYAVMFMDWFQKNYDRSAQFDILTNSKILQEQYTNDFEFMNSLWGKGSYHCEQYNTDCSTGSEFCKIQKTECEFCPYKEAKYNFETNDVALTNYHLFLTYMLYMPMAWKRSSRVLIIDEAGDFESVVCDFINTKISKPLLKMNGFDDSETEQALNTFGQNPEDLTIHDFSKIVNTEFLTIARRVFNRLSREGENDIKSLKKAQSLGNNLLKWESLLKEYESDPDNWVLECQLIKKFNKDNKLTDTYYEMSAEAVWSDKYLKTKVFNRYDYVIMMSGTLLDKNMIAEYNGFDPEEASYMSMPNPFPVENRQIFYFSKLGKQTFSTKKLTWSKQKPILEKILKKHKNDKGIIHTSNYEIQSWINGEILEDRLLAPTTDNRNDLLQFHYQSEEPTVLVSPSMMSGVDLHSDFSRFQTIIKIPYPNLGSKEN